MFNGSNWQEVAKLSGNVDSENTWHHPVLTIDGDYLVSNFQFRFRAKMDKSDEDANVDNVKLVATSLAGPPNVLPVAVAGGSNEGSEDSAVIFGASGSYDPDGTIVKYTWDFGDGTVQESTSDDPISHTYLWGAAFDVTLTVEDDRGGTATDQATVVITELNDAPVADPGGPYSGTVGSAISFNGSGSSDFDNLDGTAANDQLLTYEWDFGDETDPAFGITVGHTFAADGDYTVTLTVSDQTDSVMQSVTVHVAAEQATLHVGDLDGTINNLGRFWQAVVTITVLADGGGPVENATVYGTWSGNASGTVTVMTDLNGQATVVSQNVLYKKDSVVFTVDNITHATLSYDPDANEDPDRRTVTAWPSWSLMMAQPRPRRACERRPI